VNVPGQVEAVRQVPHRDPALRPATASRGKMAMPMPRAIRLTIVHDRHVHIAGSHLPQTLAGWRLP
jgi:hypothetical protein